MTLPLAVLFASPALFPGFHPVAVWIGVGCLALGLLVMWKADDGLGNNEGWIRRDEMATEARAWLAVMCERRVG